MHLQAKECQGSLELPQPERKHGTDSPPEPPERTNPPRPRSQVPNLQNCKKINLCCFVQSFVVRCYRSLRKPVHWGRPGNGACHFCSHPLTKTHPHGPTWRKPGKPSLAVCQESTCIRDPEQFLPNLQNHLPRGWAGRSSQTHATGWVWLGHDCCCRGHRCPLWAPPSSTSAARQNPQKGLVLKNCSLSHSPAIPI